MATSSDPQPELFGEFQPPAKNAWWSGRWRWPQRYLILRLAYEDAILAAIGGLMVVVLGFCLGVERGKQVRTAAVTPIELPAVVAPPAAAPGAPVLTPAPLRPFSTRPPIAQPATQSSPKTHLAEPATRSASEPGRYVVQVASFTDRGAAEEARARLTQRGVRATVAVKGRYHVLYAGGFATYAQASEVAGSLRPSYRDCFIRKVATDSRG